MHTNTNADKTVSLPLKLSGRLRDNVISVRGTGGLQSSSSGEEKERAINLFIC